MQASSAGVVAISSGAFAALSPFLLALPTPPPLFFFFSLSRQLRSFPFSLDDDDSSTHSTDADAVGLEAASRAVFSSTRSVSATLYPDGMLAMQQRAALEAAAALQAAKLKETAAANRLTAAAAAAAVVGRVTAHALERLFHNYRPAVAVASTLDANAADATGRERPGTEPPGGKTVEAASVLKDVSHEVAARAAERAAAEIAAKNASAAAPHANPVRLKPKPKPIPAAALPSSNNADASKRSVISTPAAPQSVTANLPSADAAAALPLSAASSSSDVESLHSILSRLDLLKLEVQPPHLMKPQPFGQCFVTRKRCSPHFLLPPLCAPRRLQP